MSSIDRELLGRLLEVMAHDMRNPLSALTTNLDYLRERAEGETREIADDLWTSTQALAQGVEHLTTIAQALDESTSLGADDGDVHAFVDEWSARSEVQTVIESRAPLARVRGASLIARLLDVIVASGESLGDRALRIALQEDAQHVHVIVRDPRMPVASELRANFFDVQTQLQAKTRSDGRYARALGWIAARALTDSVGARIVVDEDEGASRFTIVFARV